MVKCCTTSGSFAKERTKHAKTSIIAKTEQRIFIFFKFNKLKNKNSDCDKKSTNIKFCLNSLFCQTGVSSWRIIVDLKFPKQTQSTFVLEFLRLRKNLALFQYHLRSYLEFEDFLIKHIPKQTLYSRTWLHIN